MSTWVAETPGAVPAPDAAVVDVEDRAVVDVDDLAVVVVLPGVVLGDEHPAASATTATPNTPLHLVT